MTSTALVADVPLLIPGHVVQVPVAMLQPDQNQPRTEFDPEALNALAADIAARGIELPIVVRGDYTIKDGERRWRAAKIANLETVPCLLASATAGEGDGDFAVNWKLDQVADNHHREPLNPLDWARFLRELVDVHGIAVKDVPGVLAKRGITMSRSYVSNLIRLVELPDWAKDLINEGRITAAHGKHILTAKDSPTATEALRKAIDDALKDEEHQPLVVADMPFLVSDAFEAAHPDLDVTYGNNAPRFDLGPCQKCPSYKTISSESRKDRHFCLDNACFEKKQAEAPAPSKGAAAGEPQERATKQKKPDPRTLAANKRAQIEARAKKIAAERAIEGIVASATMDIKREDMLIILGALIDWQNIHAIAKRRGWELKNGNWLADFNKRAEGLGMPELQGLVIEAALYGHSNHITAIAKRHGIDIKALEKAAIEEIKQPDKKPAGTRRKKVAA